MNWHRHMENKLKHILSLFFFCQMDDGHYHHQTINILTYFSSLDFMNGNIQVDYGLMYCVSVSVNTSTYLLTCWIKAYFSWTQSPWIDYVKCFVRVHFIVADNFCLFVIKRIKKSFIPFGFCIFQHLWKLHRIFTSIFKLQDLNNKWQFSLCIHCMVVFLVRFQDVSWVANR